MQNLSQQIQRSLDRLDLFYHEKNTSIAELISTLYYSADLLKRYAHKQFANHNINNEYFKNFNNKMEMFIQRDLSGIKIHQRDVLDEILQIIYSEIFIACLHPERKFIKKTSIIQISQIKQPENKQNTYASKFWSANEKIVSSSSLKQSREMTFSKLQKTSKIKKTASQIKLDDARNLLEQIQFSYNQHKIDETHLLIQQYYRHKYPLFGNTQNYFNQIEQEYSVMMQMSKQLDRQGWKHQKTKNGIVVSSRLDKQDNLAGVKMESEFDIPIQNIMAILCEMDYMKQYTPFCFDSRLIKRPARNKVYGYCKISIPFLANRQACITAVGYDRIQKNGTIFMASRSIDTMQQITKIQKQFNVKFPKNEGFVGLKYKYFVIEYTPLTIDKARVRIASKVDMQVNCVPNFILKSSSVTFGIDYFNNIKQINKRFNGSVWDEKMRENPQLYRFFIEKISQHNIGAS